MARLPSPDILIIGAGDNGLTCACYLARAGLRVTVLERRHVVGGAAVTEEFHPGFRNSLASYTVSLLHPQVIGDLHLAEHGLRILERPMLNFSPRPDGSHLCIGNTLAETQASLSRHSARDAERLPAYASMLEKVVAVLRGARVEGVRLADGREVRADVVLNAAGPGSARVNAMAGVTAEMGVATRPMRVETATLPAPPGFDMAARGIVVSDADIGCYVKPDVGGRVSVGTEGPACDAPAWLEGDDPGPDGAGAQAELQAWRYAQRVPSVPLPGRVPGAVGVYDVSDDWLPIYDRASLPGYYMACGTSGNQFKTAPVVGRIMAALVAHCEAGGDHDARPLRVTLPMTGNAVDIGSFSRLRRPSAESSRSVLG